LEETVLHLWHLLRASAKIWLQWNSATPISVARDFVVVAGGAWLVVRLKFGAWFPTKLQRASASWKDIVVTVLAGCGALFVVLFVLFLAAIPAAISVDHNKLIETIAQLKIEKQASWQREPGPKEGPFGPIFAWELVQEFEQIHKPCNIKIRAAKDTKAFRDTFAWLLENGAHCPPDLSSTPPNLDPEDSHPPEPKTGGIVVRFNDGFDDGARIAHFLDSSALKVSISHRLPKGTPSNLIWIDIGPGSPWK
jgi:hypothetical protein